MDDFISRKEAIEAIKPLLYYGDFVSTLIHLPAADVVPVVHAYWILSLYQNEEDNDLGNYTYECSNCGNCETHAKSVYVPYCWYCGAKMEAK